MADSDTKAREPAPTDPTAIATDALPASHPRPIELSCRAELVSELPGEELMAEWAPTRLNLEPAW